MHLSISALPIIEALCYLFVFFQVVAGKPGSIRLQGPLSANGTGRVEVLHDGQWGTICDDEWDINDARVACRQLGYPDAVSPLQGGQVPAGSGPIWLDDVVCTGKERSIASCSHRGWGNQDCKHPEDAGVVCNLTGKAVAERFST